MWRFPEDMRRAHKKNAFKSFHTQEMRQYLSSKIMQIGSLKLEIWRSSSSISLFLMMMMMAAWIGREFELNVYAHTLT